MKCSLVIIPDNAGADREKWVVIKNFKSLKEGREYIDAIFEDANKSKNPKFKGSSGFRDGVFEVLNFEGFQIVLD